MRQKMSPLSIVNYCKKALITPNSSYNLNFEFKKSRLEYYHLSKGPQKIYKVLFHVAELVSATLQ
jgi:hypothetical protein